MTNLLSFFKKNFVVKIYWFYILVLGLIFIFFVPPFLKFDEIYHFGRAASIAEGNLFCVNDNGKQSYLASNDYVNLNEKLNIDIYGKPIGGKFLWHQIFQKIYINENSKKIVYACTSPLGYLPNVLGILIVHKNPILAFYLARSIGFLFFLLCLIWSLKNINKNLRIIVCLYSIIPMVLYQCTSINYDVVHLSLILPIFVLFTNIITKAKVKLSEILIFMFLLIFFQSIKASYYLFGFLPLLIPFKKISKDRFKCFVLYTIYFLINFLSIYLVLKTFYGNSSSDVDYLPLVNFKYQIEFIKNDPLFFIKMLFNNFNINGEFYLKSILGWANSEYSFITYLVLTVPFIYFVFYTIKNIDKVKQKLSLLRFVSLLTITIGTLFALFLTFYLNWTIVGSTYISGVQGRYFLVLIPFLLYLFIQLILIIGKGNFIKISLLLFVITSFSLIIVNPLFKSFYDYSNNFVENKNFIVSAKDKIDYVDISKEKIIYKKLDGYKVGGFEFMFKFDKSGYVEIPYKYELLDSGCKKTLVKGYLNLARLSAGGTYRETFGIKKLPNELCVRFTPIINDKNKNFIQIAEIDNVPIFQLLYITK